MQQFVFVLFINKRSGSKAANRLIKTDATGRYLTLANCMVVDLGSAQLDESMLQIQRMVERGNKLKIIVCGGDGTVGWVISMLYQAQVDPEGFELGVVPLGTGNDFARHFNFLPLAKMNINQILSYFQDTKPIQLDIWRASMRVSRTGGFYQIRTKEGHKFQQKVVDSEGNPAVSLDKLFTNYCSFGMDARVVYNFQQVRTRYSCSNICCYCLIGFKSLFKRMPSLQALIDSIQAGKEPLKFPRENRHLLFLNITSYMAGVRNVWNRATANLNELHAEGQQSSDQRLEVLSFRNQLSLGLQRMVRGLATPIHQGSGPFKVNFKDQQQTFLQTDGQCVRVESPQSLQVSLLDYRIRVMCKY